MSFNQEEKNDAEKRNVKIIHAECVEEVPLRPGKIKSKHKTLKEWLFAVCDGDKPAKPVEEFIIRYGVSSSSEYIFSLYGVNKFRNNTHGVDSRIAFYPSNMYFKTTKKEYGNLDWQEAREKITLQLKEILFTERVKNSFLAEANFIYFSFSGEEVFLK